MFLPEYTELPGIESAEGKSITFEKPGKSREGQATLLIYLDGLELRLITEKNCMHSVYVYFVVRGKCSGMVSTKKFNRYSLTVETLLPTAIEIRNTYRFMSFTEALASREIKFKVGKRPNIG